MVEHPILFSATMVRAILAGTKTQTRRVVKPQPQNDPARHHPIAPYSDGRGGWNWVLAATGHGTGDPFPCPYGAPSDRLWVRETYRLCAEFDAQSPSAGSAANRVWYEADAPHQPGFGKGRPSIHMPRWASRITLEITGVRVERLQAISEEDARAEGIADGGCLNCGNAELSCGCLNPRPDARDAFAHLWMSINGESSWHADPWVWAIDFRRVETPHA